MKISVLVSICVWLVAATTPSFADIEVGMLSSLSGPWAAFGDMTVKGATLAVEEINQQGGVLGEKIKLTVEDSNEADSGFGAVSAYQHLRLSKISLFIGPSGTPGALALLPLIKKDQVLFVSPSVGVRDFHEGSELAFNAWGLDEAGGHLMAAEAIRVGYRRAAVFSSDQPWESLQGRAFASEFKKLGGEITTLVEPQSTEADLRSDALRVVRDKPDLVFFSNYNKMGVAAREVQNLGYTGQKYAILVDNSTIASASGALEGVFFPRHPDPNSKFIAEFKARFGMLPDFPANHAYDSMKALATAIYTSHSLVPKKVAEALYQIDFIGASGKTSFGGERVLHPGLEIWRVQDGATTKHQ